MKLVEGDEVMSSNYLARLCSIGKLHSWTHDLTLHLELIRGGGALLLEDQFSFEGRLRARYILKDSCAVSEIFKSYFELLLF